MKKRSLFILLVCLLLTMTLPTFVGCDRWDHISFGAYPQTLVTDSAIIGTLTSAAGELPTAEDSRDWTSYGYYLAGSNDLDYMWYIDLEEGGEKYRGVYFTCYKPQHTGAETRLDNTLNLNNSRQDENGYLTGSVYWFKYEPIRWCVLEEADGEALLFAESILDSREYYPAPDSWPEREALFPHNGGTGYANNYALSSIRLWLNDDFYHTAFTAEEQARILLTTVKNDARSTNPNRNATEWNEGENANACEDTEDKIFLLSVQEVSTKDYGFETDSPAGVMSRSRLKMATDYALAQGLNTDTLGANGHGTWWLRSADFLNNHCAGYVTGSGFAEGREVVDETGCGVVPALRIKLD